MRFVKAAQEQSRADERHERHGHLTGDEHVAQVEAQGPAAAARGRLRLTLDRRHQVEAGSLNSGDETEQDSGDERECHREPQHPRLQAQIEEIVAHAGGAKRPQQIPPKVRHQDAGRSAQHGQHAALGKQLADEPPPGRADREPHGDFLPSLHGSREQQAGHVAARDEQHQSSGGEQQPARAHQIVASSNSERGFRQREDFHAAAFVFRRVLLLQTFRHGLHGLSGALQCHARLETADDLEGQ